MDKQTIGQTIICLKSLGMCFIYYETLSWKIIHTPHYIQTSLKILYPGFPVYCYCTYLSASLPSINVSCIDLNLCDSQACSEAILSFKMYVYPQSKRENKIILIIDEQTVYVFRFTAVSLPSRANSSKPLFVK